MRWSALFLLSISVSGCEDASTPVSTVRFGVVELSLPGVEACYAFEVRDAAGGLTFAAGTPTMTPATVADAKRDGAVCVPAEAAGSVVGRCTPGPSRGTLWLVGLYGPEGRIDPEDFTSPCGAEGCSKEFECVRGEETPVGFELIVMRDASQGFIDLGVLTAPPEGVGEVCYAVRVQNGLGAVVSATDNICSGLYGNGAGGDIQYVLACDSDEPDTTLTVWIQPPTDGAWAPPCAAPGGADMSTWAGGCERAVTCRENEDVAVTLDLTPAR